MRKPKASLPKTWMKRFPFSIRLTAALVLFCFTTTDLLRAQGEIPLGQRGGPANQALSDFLSSGRVESVSIQNHPIQPSLVYHIQDAHGVYEAQTNLARILEELVRKEGISLVLVEGGSGDVSLEALRKIAWKGVRHRVAEEFLREGKISGEEYLQLATNYHFELIGIEDPVLYRENVETFLKAMRRKEGVRRALSQIESQIRSLERLYFNPDFVRFRSLKERSRRGEGSLAEYLSALKAALREKGIPTSDYPEWSKFEALEKRKPPETFDANAFFKELPLIEEKVRERFLSGKEERLLFEIKEDFLLVQGLFSLELISKEYDEIRKNPGRIDLTGLQRKTKLLQGKHFHQDLSAQVHLLEEEKPVFLRFYELATRRDQVFLEKIRLILKARHPAKLVLITGGFHSERIGKLLQRERISRVLLSPEITALDSKASENYERVLREKIKSSLRAPATYGTPYFTELRNTLEQEQAEELGNHIKRLIGLLDVDEFLPDKTRPQEGQPKRSEMRIGFLPSLLSAFGNFSETGTRALWTVLLGAGLAGAAWLSFFLWKRFWKPGVSLPREREAGEEQGEFKDESAVPLESPARDGVRAVDPASEGIVIGIPQDTNFFQETISTRPEDLAKALARQTRLFFDSSLSFMPDRGDLTPPPYELPLPVAYDAIPENLDRRGKIVHMLRQVLEAMETMDQAVIAKQKEASERALARALEKGVVHEFLQNYIRYLREDFKHFIEGSLQEMKNLPQTPQAILNQAVSEEIEERHPRLPRAVKVLLSEDPTLLEDQEIGELITRITRKIAPRPPIAPDIERFVEDAFHRLNKARPSPPRERRPSKKTSEERHEAIQEAPRGGILPQGPGEKADEIQPQEESPRPRPPSAEILRARISDLVRQRQRFEQDRERLAAEITKVEREYRELIQALNQAVDTQDTIVQEALRPAVESYEARLERLRVNQGELENRITRVQEEEGRLRVQLERAELDEEGGARSELRGDIGFALVPPLLASFSGFSKLFLFVGLGALAVGAVIYLVKLTGSIIRTRSLLDSQKPEESLFDGNRIFNETMPDKPEDPKIDFFKGNEDDLSGVFFGLGVFLGWVLGGIALYQAYHGWEWDISKQFFSLGENPKGEKQYFTFGGLLWILEIFVAPILGGALGAVFGFFLQTSLNGGRRLVRRLRFPLDYERALRFYLHPFESLDSQTTRGALRLFARMEKPTLEVILQKWITQGGYEKIKFFADHAAPEPDKPKPGSQPRQSSLPFRESEKAKIIRVYDDVAGFERVKKMLTSHTEGERRKNEILEILHGWRTALDQKNLNGARLLKDLIPELAKAERYFSKVRAWTETLLQDPDTPWALGSPEVKKYYEALRSLEEVKGKARTQFSLTPAEDRLLKDHLAEWKKRIPGQEPQYQVPAVALLGALLTKAIQSSPEKDSFLRALKLVSLIPESFFRTASNDRLLRRFEETWAYHEKKERLGTGLPESKKEALESSLLTLEASLKAKNLDPLALLPQVFATLEKKTPEERVFLLQGFSRLSPEIYREGSERIQKAFETWVTKEEARERLMRQSEQVRKAVDEIEAKVSYRSLLEILSLSLIYLNLELKAKPEARGPFLMFLAGVPDSVFGVFLSSHETLLNFYLTHPTQRDFRNLGELLARYRARYGEIQVLTESLLEILTDRAKPPAQRMEEARQAISQQILLKYGYPQKVTEVWDAVSPEELLRSVGESVLRQRAGNSVVKNAVSKMGPRGLQSYWEEAKPSYYVQFLKETEGIPQEFFRPGEKFRVSYDREGTKPRKLGTLSPIQDPVRTLRELVRDLRFSQPKLYDNFISPKRELLNGRPLEEVIDERSLIPVAKQFLSKARDWPIPEAEKIELLIRTSEVLYFNQTHLLLGMRSEREEAKYWEEWLRLFGEREGFKKDSELYRSIVSQVRKQIAELTEASQAGREGLVQFILTRGSLSDFFRGEVSEDCCSEARNLHFTDTVGLPTDPAFLAFELVENGKWIGNIYSIVLKGSEGKFIFYLDNMPLRMSHPLAAKAGEFDPERRNLMKGFFERLKELLSENGFEYIALAPDPSSREHVKSAIRQILTEEKAVSRSEKTTKPGGFGHQSDFGVSSEYIQGLGTLSSSISANGSWISLESKGALRKRKEREIEEIRRSLDAAQRERARLEKIEEEKVRKLKHLEEAGEGAREKATTAVAQALQAASKKEALEAEKVSLELQEMEGQISGLRERLSQMENELSRSELRTKEAGTATLFSSLGAALLAFQHDPLPTLFFVAAAGLVFWLIWILIRGEREDSHWTERRFWLDERMPNRSANLPAPPRELWREHPLVIEVVKLFKSLFQKMSSEMKPFIPPRIFVPIGVQTGFELSKRAVTALSTARLVLTTLSDRGSILPFLKEQGYYQGFKKRASELGLSDDFDLPDGQVPFEIETRNGRKIPFSLELSDRIPDDILRGDVSRDCTALGNCSAFYETTPRFLLDPGFLNFKLRMRGAWVGNIYALVAEHKGSPVLIVDAIQLSPWAVAWPVRSQWIAERALSEIVAWSQKRNFESVLMSRFISNFFHLYDYFDPRYPPKVMEIEKLGGFEHLKALGFWDEENPRNEYLETFSPHWNQPLKEIDPNLPKQKILLRAVWTSENEKPTARSEVRAEAGSLGEVMIEGYKFHFYQNEWAQEGPNPDERAIRLALREYRRMAESFEQDGLKDHPIRVRVHTEGQSRIYKFIAEIPEGKRNYVLEMTPVDDTFTRYKARFRAYTEKLNHIENALLTARDRDGRIVGLRNIFYEHGEPPGSQNHLIPLYGRLFVEEASSDLPEGIEIKVVDLKIEGKPEPSLRAVLLKMNQSTGRKLENPKALYAYTWRGEDYVFGIYPPKAPVRWLAAEPREPQKKAPITKEPSFEEPVVSPEEETKAKQEGIPSLAPERGASELGPPEVEPPSVRKILGEGVGEHSEVPDSDVRAQSAPPEEEVGKAVEVPEPSPAAQTEPTLQAPPESVAEGVSRVARGFALAGPVGLGSVLTGAASRLGTRGRERKLREKVQYTQTKIREYQKGIEEKKNEILQEIDALGLEPSPQELLGKLQAIKERFIQAFTEEEAFLKKELSEYETLPAYAQAFEELEILYAKAGEELSQAARTVDEKIKAKLMEKLEASKEKIKRLAEDLVREAKRIDEAMTLVPVDLSPAEVDQKTQALEEELLQVAARHEQGIGEIVESFNFPELSWAYEEILSFAKEVAGEAAQALDALASPKEELGGPPQAPTSDEAILVTGAERKVDLQVLETPPVEEARPPGVEVKEEKKTGPENLARKLHLSRALRKRMEEENARLQGELKEVKRKALLGVISGTKVRELEARLQSQEEAHARQIQELQFASEEVIRAKDQEIARLQERLDETEPAGEEAKRLKQELEEAKSERKQWELEREELVRRLRDLAQKLHVSRALVKRMGEVTARLSEALEEARLKARLGEIAKERVRELEELLKKQKEDEARELGELQKKAAGLEETLRERDEALKGLRKDLDLALERARERDQENKRLNDLVGKLRKDLKERDDLVNELQATNQALKEASERRILDLQEELRKARQNESERVQALESELEEAQRERALDQERTGRLLQRAYEEVRRLRERLARGGRRVARLMAEQEEEFRQRMAALEEANERLEIELKVRDTELAALKGEIARLEALLLEREETIRQLRNELNQAHAAIAGFHARNQKLAEKNKELEEALAQRDLLILELRQANQALREALDTRTKELEGFHKLLGRATAKLTGRANTIRRLLHDLETEEKAGKAKDERIASLLNQLEEQAKDLREAREKMKTLEETNRSFKETVETASEESQELQAQREHIEQLSAELDQAKAALARLDKEYRRGFIELREKLKRGGKAARKAIALEREKREEAEQEAARWAQLDRERREREEAAAWQARRKELARQEEQEIERAYQEKAQRELEENRAHKRDTDESFMREVRLAQREADRERDEALADVFLTAREIIGKKVEIAELKEDLSAYREYQAREASARLGEELARTRGRLGKKSKDHEKLGRKVRILRTGVKHRDERTERLAREEREARAQEKRSRKKQTAQLQKLIQGLQTAQTSQLAQLSELEGEKSALLDELERERKAKWAAEDERERLKAGEAPQVGIRIDTERLTKRLTQYLAIPSGSGQEEELRKHLLKELEPFGGKVTLLGDKGKNEPLNLVWDIPASEGYTGSIRRIGLSAHTDRVTHTRTRVSEKDGYLHAEGEGGSAGLDDTLGVAAVMEVIETLKEKNIPHPQLRIIFTAEEESSSDGQGPWGGARWLVNHQPELLKGLDLLVPIDGPVLNGRTGGQDPDSPFAVKFINFANFKGPELVQSDSIYQHVLAIGTQLGALAWDVLDQAAKLGMLAAGATIVKHQPKEFNFSAGDEREFQRIKGLRIAHLRVNYQHPSGHGPKDSVKIEHLTLMAEWLLRIAGGLAMPGPDTGVLPSPGPAVPPSVDLKEAPKPDVKEPVQEGGSPVLEKRSLPAEEVAPRAEGLPLVREGLPRLSKLSYYEVSTLEELLDLIQDSVKFSYERRISSGEEFIVKMPGRPLRWIAFDVAKLGWKLYEREERGIKTYRLFEKHKETHLAGGNIELSKTEVEVSPGRRVSLARFLSPIPPVMPEEALVFPEAGGFVLKNNEGKLVLVPFLKKGLAQISEDEARLRGPGIGFFVHPGGIPELDGKNENLTVPFSGNPYDLVRERHPGSQFLLGWHTNPGGPAALHPKEEEEMMKAGVEGLQLVVTPGKVALWRYSRAGNRLTRTEKPIFESPRDKTEWREALIKDLGNYLRSEVRSGDEDQKAGENERHLDVLRGLIQTFRDYVEKHPDLLDRGKVGTLEEALGMEGLPTDFYDALIGILDDIFKRRPDLITPETVSAMAGVLKMKGVVYYGYLIHPRTLHEAFLNIALKGREELVKEIFGTLTRILKTPGLGDASYHYSAFIFRDILGRKPDLVDPERTQELREVLRTQDLEPRAFAWTAILSREIAAKKPEVLDREFVLLIAEKLFSNRYFSRDAYHALLEILGKRTDLTGGALIQLIRPLAQEGNKEAVELLNEITRLRSELRNPVASGYQLQEHELPLLDEALERAEKSSPRNVKRDVQKLLFDLATAYELEPASLESFIENSDFELVTLKPRRVQKDRAPPMGLGVDLGRSGRDVYATFQMEPKEEGNGFIVTFYVGEGIYELAGEKERLEILAHELYQAYRTAHDQNPETYPFDIDLEVKIDEEIRLSDAWEGRIPREEREDLGLAGGSPNRTNPHVRARAFARLLGSRSPSGIGTTYTDLLRRVYALEKRFGTDRPVAEDPLSMIPPLEEDSFRYTEDSFEQIVSPEDLQTLFEMSAYVHEHKEEDLVNFLGKKIEEGKRVLVLNTNAPTPWILKDIRKITEGLATEGKLTQLFLDLSPRLQPLIESYLSTGRFSEELTQGIRSRFPEFLPKEFQRPDLYENILRAVYEHNLEAREGRKIGVIAYYEPRRLPPMPQGRNLPFPGRGEFPFEPGAMPFLPPFPQGMEGARPPIMPRPGELPFPPGNLPPLPLSPQVEKSLRKAVSEVQKGRDSVILFVKPLDEFLPDQFRNHPQIASILHLDRYTGFGPKKPENKLALYMSEQASPNQKSFALPVLREAPFYEESINPGLPKGIPFNEFSAYLDLILSTSGEGDETFEPIPDEAAPEEIGPLVPVGTGPRSELRGPASPLPSPYAKLDRKILDERKQAVRELTRIGEPAVLPLIESLASPSLSVRLGAIQTLGVIGDPRAIAPLENLLGALELREAAGIAARSIREHAKLRQPETRERNQVTEPPRERQRTGDLVPLPENLYTFFVSSREDETVDQVLPFIRQILKETSLVVELDVESLVRKEEGKVSLAGWGFFETLKTLESKLPGELLDRIRIRLINLNPSLHEREIAQAFQITPEIQGMLEIRTVPVRHHAFRDLGLYLVKDSLKIATERHQDLWKEKIDILVKEPQRDELIDGRKLFLAALLHRTLRKKISEDLRLAAERLLREIGSFPVNGFAHFAAQNRSTLAIEFLNEIERINRLLSTMA